MPIFSNSCTNIFNSNQFFFLFYSKFNDAKSFPKNTRKYFSTLTDINKNFCSNRYDNAIGYILTKHNLYSGFQRFLYEKSRKFNFRFIDLNNLENTCDDNESQQILLISFLYYFGT